MKLALPKRVSWLSSRADPRVSMIQKFALGKKTSDFTD
jgi:hypothetical protein